MDSLTIRREVSLDEPFLVEGLPGVGLVGKIATDHLVDELDMTYFASIDCEGLPQVSIYREDERDLQPPVRLYADEERDLVALQSDVPVSPERAPEFTTGVTNWTAENDATPLFLSGRAHEKDADEIPAVYGVATGNAGGMLDEYDIDVPPETGVISGPTGALLNRAGREGIDAVGLIVQSDPQFPDPEAARMLIEHGINPIAGTDLDTESLVEKAEKIREQKEQLANRMGEVEGNESSEAKPLRMFQ